MKTRIIQILICIGISLLSISCDAVLSSGLSYYRQQQTIAATTDTDEPPPPPPPTIDPEDEIEPVPEGATLYTMFEVLLANGEVDESILVKFDEEVQAAVKSILPSSNHSILVETAAFENKVININNIDNYVPTLSFVNASWDLGNAEDSKAGDGFKITGVPTNPTSSEIKYYRSTGYVPSVVQGLSAKINSETYGDGTERMVERFMFYRFTGKASIASLNNMLVAVDTYTNLVFAFAYPYDFETILGNSNPSAWASLDYPFYTYDPIGYVGNDGSFTIESWYNNALTDKKGAIKPADILRTGKSPYGYTVLEGGESAKVYLENIKEKVYVYNGDPVETYTVSEDGLQIIKTGGTDKTYTFESATTDTVGTYSGATFTLQDDGNILLNENETEKLLELLEYYDLTVSATSIHNINMKSQKLSGFSWKDVSEAYMTYAVRSSLYVNGESASYTVLAEKKNADEKPDGLISNNTVTVGVGETHSVSGSVTSTVSNVQLGNTLISLDSKLVAVGYSFASFVETASNKYRVYNDYGKPNVVLKYDTVQEAFVLDSEKSHLPNTTVSDFVLRQGETKDIAVTYNNESIVTYTLSFK